MKRLNIFALIATVTLLLSSCQVIEGIFKAGVWSGILMIVVIVAIIIWLLSAIFKKK